MRFIIVTGMSGAGKSTVLRCLEDNEFYCVDNLPPVFLPEFIKIFAAAKQRVEKAAFGIDIRVGSTFDELFTVLDGLKNYGHECSVVFLDSDDDVLIKRYKETRRSHPLARNERISVGINKEREILAPVKEKADYVIDSSNLLTRQLKDAVYEIFLEHKEFRNLMINVISFGFKYGIPEDSDMLLDVRFMPNPFYTELRPLTGLDAAVRDYVLSSKGCDEFLERTEGLLDFLIPGYVSEGKNKLVIGIGCTGGKHRSVCLAEAIYNYLVEKGQFAVINHRDIGKDPK